MIDLPSLFFGALVGVFPYALTEICKQTRRIIDKSRGRSWQNAYLWMIWIEAIVNVAFSIITILYLNGVIEGSFAFYFGTVTLWAIQTQVLSQIIGNRIALIMVSRTRAKWMRLGLFVMILAVNVTVFVIWIPAYLPDATVENRRLNDIFEQFEKSFFLAVDLGLNLFFLYLVRFRLIAGGLPKYWLLFKMNAVLIVISVAMDAALLGMLSLPYPYVYVQFAPLAYIVKLYIELVMASLLANIVNGEAIPGHAIAAAGYPQYQPPMPMGYGRYGDKYGSRNSIFGGESTIAPATPKFYALSMTSGASSYYTDIEGRCEAPGDEVFLNSVPGATADSSIIKTVTTTVVSEDKGVPSYDHAANSHHPHRSMSFKTNSRASIKTHKSRLRAGAYGDWINDPSPPPPPPKDDDPALMRSRQGRPPRPLVPQSLVPQPLSAQSMVPQTLVPQPLTSRFNRRRG